MNKLTKKDIENFANEIWDFLFDNDLDSGVCIYFNNKRMTDKCTWNGDTYISERIIEEDMNPLDYFEYVNCEHILSMSFEGPLYDVLNYSFGQREDEFRNIFEKYGCYYELGNAWNLTAYPCDDNMEIEFTEYVHPKERINLYMWNTNIPSELRSIMDKWYVLSEAVGDKGSCVLGAGFYFTWNGDQYFMSACSPYQGSISWETSKDEVKAMLENISATDIYYSWGSMD